MKKDNSSKKAKSSVLKEIMDLADSVMVGDMKPKMVSIEMSPVDDDEDDDKKDKEMSKEDYAKMLGM